MKYDWIFIPGWLLAAALLAWKAWRIWCEDERAFEERQRRLRARISEEALKEFEDLF